MSAPRPLDPDTLAARFWAANAGLLESEGKLAFARRARTFFEAAARAASAGKAMLSDADIAPERERFVQAVLALHASGEGESSG